MISRATTMVFPPHWPGSAGGKRLLERLVSLRARLRSAAGRLAFYRRLLHPAGLLLRPPFHRNPQHVPASKPAAMVGMIPAALWGGPYCGDEISIPEDACRLTRPDGSVYLRSSLTDSAGRPVFMLRLGRRTLDLPRQGDLS